MGTNVNRGACEGEARDCILMHLINPRADQYIVN